jgi:hypothetical protein
MYLVNPAVAEAGRFVKPVVVTVGDNAVGLAPFVRFSPPAFLRRWNACAFLHRGAKTPQTFLLCGMPSRSFRKGFPRRHPWWREKSLIGE